jgi:hypothetical protein
MEAQAFVESDIDKLIDAALPFIPGDSIIARMIADVRSWHAANDDWYATRKLIGEHYNYELFPGACHMVPNHALIILALLYGKGDLRRSLMIANTSGWDTDCNSGNVGAILGIRDGLAAFADTPDYRWPVADRMYLSTAEGGRGITDAAIETIRVANAARALAGQPALAPKHGARFHFALPGSVQGFTVSSGDASVTNVEQKLAVGLARGGQAEVTTPTFAPEETKPFRARGYRLFASPTLYPGQDVTAEIAAGDANRGPLTARLILRAYDPGDTLVTHEGPSVQLAPGGTATLTWTTPALESQPIAEVGFRIEGAEGDILNVETLTWHGAPTTTFARARGTGDQWKQAWVDGVDIWEDRWGHDFHLTQNRGIGLIAQGTEGWQNYTAAATIRTPLAASAGLAVRVGGMQRYYALVLREGDSGAGRAQIVKCIGEVTVLAEAAFDWEVDRFYDITLSADGNQLRGTIDGDLVLEATDEDRPLTGGSAGFVVEVGTLVSGPLAVTEI